ncbi:hypothetical protein BDY19DRAFT_420867 [Irpex rosettiformis]|uniref:Uncharacterized protein n=1 Tax=Irpex rosettiformis TaxID=378272 RepID=A0ACB8UHZ4_9APHY|nr:hypothetical protein BDY19DRAFT_420867 [Irpex rosettiformis]
MHGFDIFRDLEDSMVSQAIAGHSTKLMCWTYLMIVHDYCYANAVTWGGNPWSLSLVVGVSLIVSLPAVNLHSAIPEEQGDSHRTRRHLCYLCNIVILFHRYHAAKGVCTLDRHAISHEDTSLMLELGPENVRRADKEVITFLLLTRSSRSRWSPCGRVGPVRERLVTNIHYSLRPVFPVC